MKLPTIRVVQTTIMSSPPVWSKFSRFHNGNETEFRIQEMQRDQFEEVSNLFLKYYVPEEPVHKSADLAKNEKALEEYKKHYLGNAFKGQCQIDGCCIEDSSERLKIVGGSIMYIERKSDPKWDVEEMNAVVETDEMKKFFKVVSHMCDVYYNDFRIKYNLDMFYDDIGIVVHPDYRGHGIAGELLKARMVTAKAHGVPMTGAWMTSTSSQKIAAKLGWETVTEVNYKDLEKIGGVSFEGAPPSAKMMITKV